MDLTFQVSMHYCSHSIGLYLHHAGSTVRRYTTPAAWCWRAAAMHWRDWEQISYVCCSALEAVMQCWSDCEEIPHVQGQKSPRKTVDT